MLKSLRRHPIVRGCMEILSDVALFLVVMLLVVMVAGELAKLAL